MNVIAFSSKKLSDNWKEHPVQYALNPLIDGPFTKAHMRHHQRDALGLLAQKELDAKHDR